MATSSYEQLSQRAALQMEAGNWDSARRDWLGALAIAPESAVAMLELSYVESLAGEHRAARDWALRAAGHAPRSPEALLGLVRRLRTFNAVPVLRALARRLLADPGVPSHVLAECARQLSNLNDFDLALECAESAAARSPEDLSIRLTRGQLLVHHRRIEEGVLDIEWALERNPKIGIAWWMLARLQRQTVSSNHIPELKALLDIPSLPLGDRAAASRALHKELDDIGEYAAAWNAIEEMCKARRASLRYERTDSEREFAALRALRPTSSHSGMRPVEGARTPIFVVGMHRSGTTLLEQLLSASPDVRALGELMDFTCAMRLATNHYCRGTVDEMLIRKATRIDLAEVGKTYMGDIEWRLGREPFFTDKQPSNFLNVGFICEALPDARILHMVRDPAETCFSNLRELFSEINPYSYDQSELAGYFRQYRKLMKHWHGMFPGRILDVDYAELVSRPGEVMPKVAAFCGLDYIAEMSSTLSGPRPVSTASAMQVGQEVQAREVPKWMPYESWLHPLLEALREVD